MKGKLPPPWLQAMRRLGHLAAVPPPMKEAMESAVSVGKPMAFIWAALMRSATVG